MTGENQKIELSKDEIKYLSLIHETFVNTECGKNLLAELEKRFLGAPCVPPINKHKDFPDYYPYLREGQNSLIRDFLVKIMMFKAYLEGQNNV